jgi:cation/acetate symporter
MFCLMVGTAGLPHLLTRYFTVPSVSAARTSVAWSLFFIGLLYLGRQPWPLVKYEVMSNLVGTHFDALPNWIAQWSRVDASLLSVEDINGDGILQFAEIRMGPTSSCWPLQNSAACLMCSPGWWLLAGWRRPCPRPTVCC